MGPMPVYGYSGIASPSYAVGSASTTAPVGGDLFGALDQNNDGVISRNEFRNLFSAMDQNKDGVISRSEFNQAFGNGTTASSPTFGAYGRELSPLPGARGISSYGGSAVVGGVGAYQRELSP